MENTTVLLLHGFASSSCSAKAQYFEPKFEALPQVTFHALDFNPTPADFEYMTVTGLINRLRQHLLDHRRDRVRLIGSSLGALVGLHYAHRFGGVEKMILLAPALAYLSWGLDAVTIERWKESGAGPVFHYAFEEETPLRYDYHVDGLRYAQPVPPAAPTLIIHGCQDDVVPIDHSRAYAADYPDRVQLIEVDSDHSLNDRLDLMWTHVQSFLLS